jgi:molybdopterin converting factor small subunit
MFMARILCFAQARDAIGRREVEWLMEGPQKVEELWTWLEVHHPGSISLQSHCRVACNGEYLQKGSVIMPHDEIALIPPVSGG